MTTGLRGNVSVINLVFTTMKRLMFIFAVYCGLACRGSALAYAAVPETAPTVYQGIHLSASGDERVAGVSMSRYGYRQFEQYVELASHTLYLLGQTDKQEYLLSSVSLQTGQQQILAKYPIEGFFPITELTLTAFLVADESPAPYVLVTYTENTSGMRAELVSTIIEIFQGQGDGTYRICARQAVERVNIAYQEQQTWHHYRSLAVNDSPTEDTAVPARKTLVDMSVNDLNHDGYADIQINTHHYRSRMIAEAEDASTQTYPDDEDFVFDRDETWGMLFLPQTTMFSPLTRISQ